MRSRMRIHPGVEEPAHASGSGPLRSLAPQSRVPFLHRCPASPRQAPHRGGAHHDRRTGGRRRRIPRSRPRAARPGAQAPARRVACGHGPALLPRDAVAGRRQDARHPDSEPPSPAITVRSRRCGRRSPKTLTLTQTGRRGREGDSHDRIDRSSSACRNSWTRSRLPTRLAPALRHRPVPLPPESWPLAWPAAQAHGRAGGALSVTVGATGSRAYRPEDWSAK